MDLHRPSNATAQSVVDTKKMNYTRMSTAALERALGHAAGPDRAEIEALLRDRRLAPKKDRPYPFPAGICADVAGYDGDEHDDVGEITATVGSGYYRVALAVTLPNNESVTLRFDAGNAAALAAVLAAGSAGLELPSA